MPRLSLVTPICRMVSSLAFVNAGFALERDLLGVAPGRHGAQPRDQAFELLRGKKRRCSAAEILTKLSGRPAMAGTVTLPFPREHIEIRRHLLRVLVGIRESSRSGTVSGRRGWEIHPERDPGAGFDCNAGRASPSTAAAVHTENGGYVATK